jgi:D-alanine-D-alanine ligase
MATLPSILILHNLPRESAAGDAWAESDAGVLAQVQAVAAALSERGYPHRIAGLRRIEDVPQVLSAGEESIVFNLVEDLATGAADAYLVPVVCRAWGMESTGNDAACQLLCMDKWQAKAVLSAHGVPTPPSVLAGVGEGGGPDLSSFRGGRVIVKPAATDASEGIDAGCVRPADDPELPAVIRRVRDLVKGGPVLIEAFVEGRELNVSVIECDGELSVLPIAEIEFRDFGPDRPHIVDYAAKWKTDSFEYANTVRKVPADLPAAVAKRVGDWASAAWRAAGCRDYARVDFRLAADGTPYVLELNPNPDISPDAGFAAALKQSGTAYASFVESMVQNALRRLQARRGAARAALSPRAPADVVVQWTGRAERDAILGLVRATQMFRDNEIETAREVLDDALRDGPGGHYQSFTALKDGRPAGWVCWGPTPCTVGTYDIYWIVVDPSLQRSGVGLALMAHAEALIRQRGGRLVVVETSGRPDYEPTRRFYDRCGYALTAQVAGFYAPGDPKQMLTKSLPAAS